MSSSNNPNQPPQRLLSTRSKANLAGASKPKFAINKNVVRKKKESDTPSLLENLNPKSKDADGGQRNKNKDRAPRKKTEIVYTTSGLFSQGPASVSSVGTSSRHYGGGTHSVKRGPSTSGAGVRSSAFNKGITRADADYEAYGKHSFLFDAKPNERTVEVQQLDTDITVNTLKPEVKPETKPETSETTDSTTTQHIYDININGENAENDTPVTRLDTNPWPKSDQFMFLHLPPQLPKPVQESSPEAEPNATIEVDTKPNEDVKVDSNQNNGLVGKLRRYRSGKVQLVYGNLVMDVTKSKSIDFMQNVMAIDPNSTNGFIAHLGSISDRLVGTPDIEFMLNQLQLQSDEMKVE